MKCKIFTIFLFLVASFWFGYQSLANDIVDDSHMDWVNLTLPVPTYTTVGQRFVPAHNNISAVEFYTSPTGTTTTEFVLCSGTPNNLSQADVDANLFSCNWAGNTLLYHNLHAVASSTCTGGCWIYNLPTPIALTAGQNYYFGIKMSQGSDYIKVKYNNTQAGMILNSSQWGNSTVFKEFYSDTYTPPPPPPTFQINLLTPSPIAPFTTYYGQPASYTFTYENPLNWYPQIRFMVKRKADPRASAWRNYINSSTFWTSSVATSTLTFATSTFQLPDGYYDLDAYFWANIPASPVHATTTFTINTGGSYGGYSFATSTLLTPPTFSTADLCGDIATTTTFGAIECGLIKAFVSAITWAFAPSFDTLTNFKVSFELFKGCFPFNTYFQLTDTITSVASSTASTTAGTIKIPFIHSITGGGTFYMLDTVSSSTLPNWIGVSNYNLFRTTIGYFFWLIAVAVVFFTVKYI